MRANFGILTVLRSSAYVVLFVLVDHKQKIAMRLPLAVAGVIKKKRLHKQKWNILDAVRLLVFLGTYGMHRHILG